MRAGLLVLSALLTACGGSVTLSNLRCDGACQSVPDPFRLTLAVDYADPDGALGSQQLHVVVSGRTAAVVPLDPLLKPTTPGHGSIAFEVPMSPARVNDGDTFEVTVETDVSNSVRRSFTFEL